MTKQEINILFLLSILFCHPIGQRGDGGWMDQYLYLEEIRMIHVSSYTFSMFCNSTRHLGFGKANILFDNIRTYDFSIKFLLFVRH